MAGGEPPQGRAECPFTNGRSPGSRVSRDRSRSCMPFLAFPELPRHERGRFVEEEASTPVVRAATPVAFPMSSFRRFVRTMRRIAPIVLHQTERPRRSTVAGSAAMRIPGLGPSLRIPFSSPPETSGPGTIRMRRSVRHAAARCQRQSPPRRHRYGAARIVWRERRIGGSLWIPLLAEADTFLNTALAHLFRQGIQTFADH